MPDLKVGDILIAKAYSGLVEKTTEGKEYSVSKVEKAFDGRTMFWIIDDNGDECFPVSTSFKRKS